MVYLNNPASIKVALLRLQGKFDSWLKHEFVGKYFDTTCVKIVCMLYQNNNGNS